MVLRTHPEQSDSPQARAMKKKAVSKIARGKLAKAVVFRGQKEKTSSGHSRSDLMKNKRNKAGKHKKTGPFVHDQSVLCC